jgi:hypothetical protein
MTKATEQLISNALTWAASFATILIFKGASGATDSNETLRSLMDISQISYIIFGCLFSFTLFSLLAHKAKNMNEEKNAKNFGALALEELGSNMYTFGSLCTLIAIFLNDWPYLLGTVTFWSIGYWLKSE